MKKQGFEIHKFVCPECNNVVSLPRKKGRLRQQGHIKDLYCPFCKKVTKMKEYYTDQGIMTLSGEILK